MTGETVKICTIYFGDVFMRTCSKDRKKEKNLILNIWDCLLIFLLREPKMKKIHMSRMWK